MIEARLPGVPALRKQAMKAGKGTAAEVRMRLPGRAATGIQDNILNTVTLSGELSCLTYLRVWFCHVSQFTCVHGIFLFPEK